jgi:hypothetical protein
LLDDLLLTLTVNGEVRQKDNTMNLVFKPADTLAELTTFSDLSPGLRFSGEMNQIAALANFLPVLGKALGAVPIS